jgi:mannose-6-phosphate isomerase-like protein (cupin superfamily)
MSNHMLPHRAHDERPWGAFEQFTQNEDSTVKILIIHAGQQFSLQTHDRRDEFWRIMSGSGVVTVGDEELEAQRGDEFWVPRGSAHRAHANDTDLVILEISFGQFDENDIKRLKDDYGRA